MSNDAKFQEFYALEAGVYEKTRYGTRYGTLFRQLHHHVLKAAVADTPPTASCLEVACGTGHTTRVLSAHFDSLTACDLTPEMMSHNRGSTDRDNVTYRQANAFELPFPDNSFDVLVSTRFFHLFAWHDQQRLFAEFHRVLKPGGKLIVDFDNIVARWLYVIPHVLYNLLRYQRLAPFSIYNFPGKTRDSITAAGFDQTVMNGVGGWHLIAPALFSAQFAFRCGLKHQRPPLLYLAEQFLISARKTAAA